MLYFLKYCALLFYLLISYTNSYSFNSENVRLIKNPNTKNNYFSYKLLLQSNETEAVLIVSAPKRLNSNSGGDLYRCDLNSVTESSSSECSFYNFGRQIEGKNEYTSNLFGISLDGDNKINGPLVACAPRSLNFQRFSRGYCGYLQDSSQIHAKFNELKIFERNDQDVSCADFGIKSECYYNVGFAEAGLDLSYNSKEVLIGAPGVLKFSGSTIAVSLTNNSTRRLPQRLKPTLLDEDTYFGYSVSSAQFTKNNDAIWYIAGAPKANNLRGKVSIYYYVNSVINKIHTVASFEGDEFGTYFGATILAQDVNGDNFMDLLIGAPNAAGKTWDEGNVHFFQAINEKSFYRRKILQGDAKTGGKFGSAISPLGDFDLDGFNDVAISAPYEDDNSGAIYIYRGYSEGLSEDYSQKIKAKNYYSIVGHAVKGFGLGLSKGTDINNDGHNDFAIGAYKSDIVFLITSFPIVEYFTELKNDLISIRNTTNNFDLEFCVYYTTRSKKSYIPKLDFQIYLELDYRAVQKTIIEQITANLHETKCRKFNIQLKPIMMDISPFPISLTINATTKNLIAHGDQFLNLQIPYSHGCGIDNICELNLSIELNSPLREIILGVHKQVEIKIVANNSGEPGYQCKIILNSSNNGLNFRNSKDCIKTDDTSNNYTCSFHEILTGTVNKFFIYDITSLSPETEFIEIEAHLTCSGTNKPNSKNSGALKIPVVLENESYIIGKVEPQNAHMELKTDVKNIEVIYQFIVGKNGPSPLKINMDIFIPIIELDGQSVLDIIKIEGKIDNSQIECIEATFAEDEKLLEVALIENLKIPINKTILISCNKNSEEKCRKYSCSGDYIYSSTQIALVELKTKINSNLLMSKFNNQFINKQYVVIAPIAYQKNATDRISVSQPFEILIHGSRIIPLWVYLISTIAGVILLALSIFLLYKCNFFKRIYKDKLEQEKILDPLNSEENLEDATFDNVEFRNPNELKMIED